MINSTKARIQHSFNKAFESYDDNASFQRKICEQLLIKIRKIDIKTEIIADLACGTGISTQAVSNSFNYENLYAIDFCEKLLMQAKKKLKQYNINFILADFDDEIFYPNSLHLILCNMGFQWALDLKKTFITVCAQLMTNGILAFSIPLEGTFYELSHDRRNRFLTSLVIASCLKETGFEICDVVEKKFVEHFKSTIEAMQSIKSIGANCLMYPRDNRVKYINSTCKTLTYQIGFFIVKKISDHCKEFNVNNELK